MSELDTLESRRETECLRKRRYKPGARRRLNLTLRNLRRAGKEVTPYFCEHCGGIHISSAAKSKRLRAAIYE